MKNYYENKIKKTKEKIAFFEDFLKELKNDLVLYEQFLKEEQIDEKVENYKKELMGEK